MPSDDPDTNRPSDHEYERKNPGAKPPTPHRPDSAYGMDKGKAGGTYGTAEKRLRPDDAEPVGRDKPDRKTTYGDKVRDETKSSNPTPGGLPPEQVEDRPNVSMVEPEDYPKKDRDAASPD